MTDYRYLIFKYIQIKYKHWEENIYLIKIQLVWNLKDTKLPAMQIDIITF